MKNNNRANSILTELMIAVLFFALVAVVLVELFAGAGGLSLRADRTNRALPQAQSLADALYAADDMRAYLDANLNAADGVWTRAEEDYSIEVTLNSEAAAAGHTDVAQIRALDGETELFTLESAKYIPEEAAA